MNRRIFIIILSVLPLALCAQTLKSYEYWFDSDYANRQEGRAADGTVSLSLNVAQMPDGVHSLTFRAADSKGRWSAPLTHIFVKAPVQPATNGMARCEYWLDGAAGKRAELPMADGVAGVSLDMSALLPGVHSITLRAADVRGQWSAPVTQMFLKTRPAAQLVRYEYWMDRDEAHRKAVATADGIVNLDIDASQPAKGVHSITFRAADTRGEWSAPVTQMFLHLGPAFDENAIAGYQYWVNDAGHHAQYVAVADAENPFVLDEALLLRDFNMEITPENECLVQDDEGTWRKGTKNVLHLRFQDLCGQWSELQADTFRVAFGDDGLPLGISTARATAPCRVQLRDAELTVWDAEGATCTVYDVQGRLLLHREGISACETMPIGVRCPLYVVRIVRSDFGTAVFKLLP